MSNISRPDYAPVANIFFGVTASVATSASAAAAGVGPFRGLFFITSSSVTIRGVNGNNISVDNVAKNTTLWIAGEFCTAIATATAQFGVM